MSGHKVSSLRLFLCCENITKMWHVKPRFFILVKICWRTLGVSTCFNHVFDWKPLCCPSVGHPPGSVYSSDDLWCQKGTRWHRWRKFACFPLALRPEEGSFQEHKGQAYVWLVASLWDPCGWLDCWSLRLHLLTSLGSSRQSSPETAQVDMTHIGVKFPICSVILRPWSPKVVNRPKKPNPQSLKSKSLGQCFRSSPVTRTVCVDVFETFPSGMVPSVAEKLIAKAFGLAWFVVRIFMYSVPFRL